MAEYASSAHGKRPSQKRASTQKRAKQVKEIDYDLRDEYDLSKMTIVPKNVVVLDPDVAQAFPTDELVSAALRLVVQIAKVAQLTMPESAAR